MAEKLAKTAKASKPEKAAKSKQKAAAGKKESKLLKTAKSKQDERHSGRHRVTSNRLKLMITIVSRHKTDYYMDLIQSFDVNMQLVALAHGTANAKMLGYLGLTDNEKSVIFSVIQENKLPDALHVLDEKFKTIRDGKGVAFTVPLTSVIGSLIYRFLSDSRMEAKESKK